MLASDKGLEQSVITALQKGVTKEHLIGLGVPHEVLLSAERRFLESMKVRSRTNPISLIARSGSHLLLAGRTGTGKTSILKALIADSCNHYESLGKKCYWLITSFKPDNFFGWSRKKGQRIVTRLPLPSLRFGEEDPDDRWLVLLCEQVNRVYSLFESRLEEAERRVQDGLPEKKWDPVFFLIDEYSALLMNLQKLPKRREFEETEKGLKSKMVADTRGQEVIKAIQTLLVMGRSSGVFVWITGQSSNCEDLGFSDPMRDSLSFLSLGRAETDDGTIVGYKGLYKALKNSYIFPDREEADPLTGELRLMIEERRQAIAERGREEDKTIALLCGSESILFLVPNLSNLRNERPLPPAVPG